MNEQEAFEACREQNPYDIWCAALEWARSQQKPVAWFEESAGGNWFLAYSKNPSAKQEPLYAHPAPIPEGYVLVPKEPTPEMIEAFNKVPEMAYNPASKYRTIHTWQAMLAAAPKPEK